MGFFARLARIIRANLNDLISSAEDPEKMLEQLVLDMTRQLAEAKKQVAVAIADEKKLRRRAEAERAEAKKWEEKAVLALKAGDEQLAREALVRKKQHDGIAAQYQEQWERQKQAVAQLKLALRALDQKIDEARRKKAVLIARKRRAEAMKRIQSTMSGLADNSAFEAFERMERKIDQAEAEAEAHAEMAAEMGAGALDQRFAQLESERGADEELEALKRKLGLVPETPAEAPAVAARVEEAGATEAAPSEEELEMAELEAALEALKQRELAAEPEQE